MRLFAFWMLSFAVVFGFVCSPAEASALGMDLLNAPPSFSNGGRRVVPVDILFHELSLVFDVAARRVRSKARIEFYAQEAGHPMLDMVPNATGVRLNGEDLGAGGMPLISSPDLATRLRMVNAAVPAFSSNLLEIEFDVRPSDVTFGGSGARLVWAMSDVGADRGFLERYAPSNLEFDTFPMELDVSVLGGRATHTIYTNGEMSSVGSDHWKIVFPDYFTTSSFYFHITDRAMPTAKADYQGLNAVIPITVYSDSASLTNSGLARTKALLAELEAAYGAFPHQSVVAYLQNGGGGMEHSGATITSLGALGHELTHSWFARGVMPADGNSGWIDEAVASWRDNGYPSNALGLTGNPVNLASFSKYRRDTPQAAYSSGARLLSGFNALFPGGLKKVLRAIFTRMQRKVITTPVFESLVAAESGRDVSAYFKRYVYNSTVRTKAELFALPALAILETPMASAHPRALTAQDIARLR